MGKLKFELLLQPTSPIILAKLSFCTGAAAQKKLKVNKIIVNNSRFKADECFLQIYEKSIQSVQY